MAKILTGPTRFTHPEWTYSNKTKFKNAEVERAAAERLIDESKRLSDETEKTTDKTQRDVNKKLEQRLDDIKFWKEELDRKLEGISNETDSLLAYKTRLEKALESCEEPVHIANQCLFNREGRKSIDLVHDDVHKELLKEVETINGVKALLQRTIEQATEQIRLNRKAKYRLEKDLKDKFAALNIDEFCENLKNNSPGLDYKDGVAKIEANSVTPIDWEDFSNENIENAAREENASIQLRSLIDGILQQTANDMTKQCDAVNLAFNKRIDETRDTKGKLEEHLARVSAQINKMVENIALLEKSIKEKEDPMKLSQTRLGLRQERPNVELCRDSAQYRLKEEANEIQENIDRLKEQLAAARSSLKGLVRRQLDLEEDIEVKSNTLHIDEVECMGMRKSINIQAF
ncbi:tektin-1-like [Tubulanus polymorphus]|uniref:tektin-1-like n=1 Tax=Tubulanus polymorphus TaxID=672921 RepID=UPI003DA4EA25